jgi:hypothetical protein
MLGLSFVFLSGTSAVAAYALFVFAVGVASVSAAAALLRRLPLNTQGLGTAVAAFIMVMAGLGSGPTIVALVKQHILGDNAQTGSAIFLVGVLALLPALAVFSRPSRTKRASQQRETDSRQQRPTDRPSP